MPRPTELEPFNPSKPVLVRRPFIGSGRHYSPGEVFDWKRLSVDQRRVRLLFESGKLMHEAPMEVRSPTGPASTPQAPVADAPQLPVPDDLEAIDDIKELRRIADEIGAPYKVSKADQRQAIREAREA